MQANDSTSNLGNTISGVIQNAAPLMRKEKKYSNLQKNPNVKFPRVLFCVKNTRKN